MYAQIHNTSEKYVISTVLISCHLEEVQTSDARVMIPRVSVTMMGCQAHIKLRIRTACSMGGWMVWPRDASLRNGAGRAAKSPHVPCHRC